jgi:cytoskeletal protein RodZ
MIENEPDPLRRIPTKHAAAVRAEVGAILRAARLKRGQTIENVAETTRIPKRYLEALEQDRLEEFPAFVYMRGFLKSYCDHLDLPFDDVWSRVESGASSSTAPAAPAKPAAPAAPAAPVKIASRAAEAPRTPPAAAPAPAAPPRPAAAEPQGSSAAGAVLLAVALALGLGVWLLHDVGRPPAPQPVESTPRVLLPLARPTESKVVLRASDDCWVRVAVDGNGVFEGRLPRGAAMDWTPARSLTLRATVPSALKLSVNGVARDLGAPTPDGEYKVDFP